MNNYIGEIRLFSGAFAPANWRSCDGSLLNISEYEALFTLLGTTYGGDGMNTFALPDLRKRVPVGNGRSTTGSDYYSGMSGGFETTTLTANQMPAHNHALNASSADATTGVPTGNYLAAGNGGYPNVRFYMPPPAGGTSPNATLDTATVSNSYGANGGGTNSHDNMMPYLTMFYIIATVGMYPSRG